MKCNIVLFHHIGSYPHRIKGVPEEDFQIIKNFLNSFNQGHNKVGYSTVSGGDCINEEEWKLLHDNAELLGIEFIVEESR
jgi:hypothetical protein